MISPRLVTFIAQLLLSATVLPGYVFIVRNTGVEALQTFASGFFLIAVKARGRIALHIT